MTGVRLCPARLKKRNAGHYRNLHQQAGNNEE
jgi:hypothetical protein